MLLNWAATQNTTNTTESKNTPSIEPKLLVIATDTMRSHAKRPGLLQSDYSYNLPHPLGPVVTPFAKKDTPTGDFKVNLEVMQKSAEVQALLQRVSAATDNLNMHLNKCVHIEKTFLGKVRTYRCTLCCLHVSLCSFTEFARIYEDFRFYMSVYVLHTFNIHYFFSFFQISAEDVALVPRNEVLLGHMLAASLAQFKYPEEWQFFLRTEVWV